MISKSTSDHEKSQLWRTEEKPEHVVRGICIVLSTTVGCLCWQRQVLSGLEGNTNSISTYVRIFQDLAADNHFSNALQGRTALMNFMLICRSHFQQVYEIKSWIFCILELQRYILKVLSSCMWNSAKNCNSLWCKKGFTFDLLKWHKDNIYLVHFTLCIIYAHIPLGF